MNKNLFYYIAFGLGLCSLYTNPLILYSQTKDEIIFLKEEKGEIFITPYGEKAGEVFNILPLLIRDEHNDWVKVRATFWVRKDSLNFEENVLRVTSFEKYFLPKNFAKGIVTEKVEFIVYVKNYSNKTIISWDGILTIESAIRKPMFSVRLKNKKLNIEPKDTYKFKIGLMPEQFNGEGVYFYLKTSKKESLNLELKIIKYETQ